MKYIILILVTVFLYTVYIRLFKSVKQYERDEGPKTHKKKNGTITMGGIIFIIIPLFFITYDSYTFSIVLVVLSYSILGLIDDLLIVIKKNNKGINANLKLLIEVIISGISFYLLINNKVNTCIDIFNLTIDLKWAYGLLIMLMLVSSTNSFNLMDGIDGLLSGVAIIMGICFIYIAYTKNEYNIMNMLICFILPLFIFWCFNFPKAFLFMGDVGSLGLGALFSITAIYLDSILAYLILAILFILEALSVIIQVIYYKKTKKRIFKMAPLHHHLELSGFSELKIDLLFYLVEVVLVLIVILC